MTLLRSWQCNSCGLGCAASNGSSRQRRSTPARALRSAKGRPLSAQRSTQNAQAQVCDIDVRAVQGEASHPKRLFYDEHPDTSVHVSLAVLTSSSCAVRSVYTGPLTAHSHCMVSGEISQETDSSRNVVTRRIVRSSCLPMSADCGGGICLEVFVNCDDMRYLQTT